MLISIITALAVEMQIPFRLLCGEYACVYDVTDQELGWEKSSVNMSDSECSTTDYDVITSELDGNTEYGN